LTPPLEPSEEGAVIVAKNLHVGIILRLTWRQLLYFLVMGLSVPALRYFMGWDWMYLSAGTVGPLGTALAIFLAFRNSSAYDRWWEARKLWGSLVNQSRTFARQALTFVRPGDDSEEARALRRALVQRQIAYCYALKCALRRTPKSLQAPLAAMIDDETERARVSLARNAPTVLLQIQGEVLARAHREGGIDGLHHVELERTLGLVTDVQGGCERIKNTPFLRQYDYYPRIFVFVYTFFVPFSIVDDLEWFTPLLSVPVSFLFLALARVGAINEDPFEDRFTDVPLDALCRTIEISLKEQLGDPALPSPAEPVNGFLT
jgi:ion channel-forming bestrophin family protein